MFKRLVSFLMVISLLFSTGFVDAVAIAVQDQEDQPEQVTVQVGDVSDMFVVEETEPEPTETEATEATETTAPAETNPVIITAEATDFTYTVLESGGCSITAYTGAATAELVIPGELDGYVVEAIGRNAFYKVTTLQSVTLPDSVLSIGSQAFYGCTALTDIRLSANLTEIDYGAFMRCTGLTQLALPATVKTIGGQAFVDCTSLSSVTYPAGLEDVSNMGEGIFAGCTALTSMEIPEGVTALPAYIFQDAASLQSVTLPSTLETIGNYAFEGSGVVEMTLPASVTSIGSQAFANCTALTDIQLSESLTEIGYGAFMKCTGLTQLELPNTVKSIGGQAFVDCTNLASVTYPAGLEDVSNIGDGIFVGCTALTYIEIPEGVTVLPDYVFQDAASLQSVSLPSTLETIGDYAFESSGIVEMTLPASVTSVGSQAFANCAALTDIQLSESLTEIGYGAFMKCTGLTQLELPNTVKSIGGQAFVDCTNLASVTYPASLENVSNIGDGIFVGCTALTYIEIPEGVTALPDYVFQDAISLQSVSLPSTLKTIGAFAFEGSGIVEMTLPASVTSIGGNAFANCAALTNIRLSESLTAIGYSAFMNCTGLTQLELPDTVKSIGGQAFANCDNLASVTYPASLENVSNIGDGIFVGCTSLTYIEIPEGVTVLPDYVFQDAANLLAVTLPSTLERIGNHAFEGTGIVAMTLPASVTSIGSAAFLGCEALTDLQLSANLTEIGYQAFMRCTSLTSIQMPQTLTSLGSGAFRNCTALESVVLSDGIKELERESFSGCSSLTAVHLSRNLKYIRAKAFENCAGLTELYIPDSVTSIADNAFTGIPALTLRCSLGSAAAEFALDNRIPMIPTQISGDGAASELDTEKSYYIHNYDGLSAAGVMSMSVHYEMKADATVAPTAITIHIYDFAALQENTLTLDGQLCTNYEYDEATGRLTVPVTATSGTLRFCMKPLRYEALTSYARLICTDGNGNESIELIGAVHSLMPVLNISAPAETAANTVYITGLAIPEAEVSVFLDGVFQKKVMANKVGDYSATVSLGDPEDGKEYIITVEAVDRNGSPAVAQANVRYRYNAPVLTGFVMRYNHKTVDLMNLQGTRPVMVFRSDATFHFEVSFENPESVSSVYVVSTRSNVKKYIKAYWSQEKEMFVAEGYFDPLDHSYVPGTITLEYVRGGEKVSFDREIDYASPEAIDALPQLWKDADIDIITNTETEVALDITAGYGDDQVSFELSITRSEIPSYLTPATAESYGYTKMTDDYGRDMYVRSHGGSGKSLVPQFSVIDFLGDEASDYCIDQIKDAFGEAFEAAGKSGNVFWSALGIAFTLQDGIGTYKDIKELQKVAANNPALTAEEKQMFNEQAMHMQHLNGFSTVVQLALGAASIYALIAFPPAVPIIAVGAAAVGAIFDLTMKLKMWELTAMAYGINGKFKWAIDPSGYVYDTVTGLRLGGVTVHAYWIENVDEDPNFFNNKPAEDEYGVLWASMEYSQMNPLLTDENGCYAWDVPEGWWRVSYEKEGYESTWSEWLPVPPPQTDVNIGLTPLVVNHLPGDIDGDRAVTQEDVVYLLLYTTFGGENYPLNFASGDIDGNETVNENDVVYLLLHTLYGEATYPLIAQ